MNETPVGRDVESNFDERRGHKEKSGLMAAPLSPAPLLEINGRTYYQNVKNNVQRGASVMNRSGICQQRLVIECHFFGSWGLEAIEPSSHSFAFDRRFLQAPALNPVEEDIRGCV
jgi:hypothetical protein